MSESATVRATKAVAKASQDADAYTENCVGAHSYAEQRMVARSYECGILKSIVYKLAGELDAKNLPMTDDDNKFVEYIYDQIVTYQVALSRRNLGDAGKTATSAMQIALDGLGDLMDELANPQQVARNQEDAAWLREGVEA